VDDDITKVRKTAMGLAIAITAIAVILAVVVIMTFSVMVYAING
jgi:hypothetical protein|tara:strand:- start:495 stop:626 length:132 start_codon:yes stop_codon:yes gene_type:complete